MTRWEGSVDWIDDSTFGAQLIDRDTDERISAEIYRAYVSEVDQELIQPGALFYWTVPEDGTAEIKFRRLEDLK